MPTVKLAVTIDEGVLRDVDRWIAAGEFPNRSRALQAALVELRERRARRRRLLHELARLDRREEGQLAEERSRAEVAWPEY
jgi:Arc/MetJ-type ribon-helix-helix transcriptional regulator